jgi:hypothetical protein
MCRYIHDTDIPNLTGPQMVSMLPNPETFKTVGRGYFNEEENWPGLTEALKEKLPILRKAVDDCPACLLSAIRQLGIRSWMADIGFDYKTEKEQFWKETNDDRGNYGEY